MRTSSLSLPSHGLKTLDLDKTRISNAGLSHVKKLAHLECLSLNHTKVDDAGLQHLRVLGKLTWLSLVDTAISDRGLDHLQEIPSLRSLALVQTRVTPSGLEALQAPPVRRRDRVRLGIGAEPSGESGGAASPPTTDLPFALCRLLSSVGCARGDAAPPVLTKILSAAFRTTRPDLLDSILLIRSR